MRRVQTYAIFALLALPALANACGQPSLTPTPTSTPDPVDRCLREIFPQEWRIDKLQRVSAGGETSAGEWVVFYRVGDSSASLNAVAYRLAGGENGVPSLVGYRLDSPYGGHVCECQCRAERDDLLSAWTGPELVIRDECGEECTRLLAYRWVTTSTEYELLLHFDGLCIDTEIDRVMVSNDAANRAELARRCAYSLPEGEPVPGEQQPLNRETCPQDCELVFSGGLPDDVLASPYPEAIVLAFYSQYTDTAKTEGYFAAGSWELMGRCEAGRCGCPVMPSPIARVRVIEMEVHEDRHHVDCTDQECPPDNAAVETKAICKYEDGSRQTISVTWLLMRENSGWRLMSTAESPDGSGP
jgi:hypothetical protein